MAEYQNNGYQPYSQSPQSGQYPPQYQQPQQPQYTQTQYQQPYAPVYVDKTREVMSIGSYLGVFFISMIPLVNIICWIVWLASADTNKNKKNYIIASIIFSVIVGVVYGILIAILITAGVLTGNELFNF